MCEVPGEVIHRERIDKNGEKVTCETTVEHLPNGTFINSNGEPFLISAGRRYHWTPSGYEKPQKLGEGKVTMFTHMSIVNAFKAGYDPQISIQE
jgi:hypothetical protein